MQHICLALLLLSAATRAFTVPPPHTHKSASPSQRSAATRLFASTTASTLQIGKQVGKGSYGVVHLCTLGGEQVICKRPYVFKEVALNFDDPKERIERCQYYGTVERHCFEKLSKTTNKQVPNYRGVYTDCEGNEWMTFDLVHFQGEDGSKVTCPSLDQVMGTDWKVQHNGTQHHLSTLTLALGLPMTEDSFSETLDCVITSLLQVLAHIHEDASIVHRDVKPGNLLVDPKLHSLVLIDFGSAADMDPISTNKWFGKYKRVGLEDHNRVAVSPVYSAPEVFIQPEKYVVVYLVVIITVYTQCSCTIMLLTIHSPLLSTTAHIHFRSPFAFDVFSAALIICQLLFNFLDERTDAGFHQQLTDANFDLDTWLSRELASKVRPAGLEEALEYLGERPGLWRLLGDMLRRNPEQRTTSQDALRRWQFLQTKSKVASDGPFFESVVALMEECEVAPPAVQRPLHFVATFRRHVPLGLVLSEADATCTDPKWIEATKDVDKGDVFVQRILPDSQASQMGIFEVGDRLQGVGELPLAGKGFERVLEMLEQQPKSAKYVKLHLDRQPARRSSEASDVDGRPENHAKVVSQGAWSSTGRRKAQEDTFGTSLFCSCSVPFLWRRVLWIHTLGA